MTSRLLQSLRGQVFDRPPFWFMRQAGRYLPEYRDIRSKAGGFLELCYTPELAIEVTLQPIRRFQPDAAILFSDILVVPHALGQEVRFTEGIGPQLDAIASADDLAWLAGKEFARTVAPVFETVKGVKQDLPEEVCLLGFAGAPWTVATYMVEGGSSRDFATTKKWARHDPAGFDQLLNILVDATAQYLVGQIEAGADALQLFDTWAGAVPADQFDRLVIQPTKAIVERVRAQAGDVLFIGFPRGAAAQLRRYADMTGINGVSIDSSTPVSFAAEQLQPAYAVQGNLDPLAVVTGGDAMIESATAIIKGLSAGPFIFNLGHGIVPQTPPEHIERLAAFIRRGGSA